MDLEDLATHLGLEFVRRTGGGRVTVIHDHDLVGESVGFLEVLGRQQDGRASGGKGANRVPCPAAGVEAGRRLIEKQRVTNLPLALVTRSGPGVVPGAVFALFQGT